MPTQALWACPNHEEHGGSASCPECLARFKGHGNRRLGVQRGESPEGLLEVSLRMYRGLKEPYDPTRGTKSRFFSTDFADCAYTALRYALGRRGVVLVLDVPDGAARVSEELWIGPKAKRLMIWGRFDSFIIAELPAKELRAQVRRKGIVTLSDDDKSRVLGDYIRGRLLNAVS